VLAVAYMYIVTLLAWMMFRRPADPVWPALLAQAKFASALVSILLFALAGPYLVYAANGVVDGLIGVAVLLLRRHLAPPRSSPVGGWR
jgi:succinate dehydrogenase/fumarate reductase cytochrome b subunit